MIEIIKLWWKQLTCKHSNTIVGRPGERMCTWCKDCDKMLRSDDIGVL